MNLEQVAETHATEEVRTNVVGDHADEAGAVVGRIDVDVWAMDRERGRVRVALRETAHAVLGNAADDGAGVRSGSEDAG